MRYSTTRLILLALLAMNLSGCGNNAGDKLQPHIDELRMSGGVTHDMYNLPCATGIAKFNKPWGRENLGIDSDGYQYHYQFTLESGAAYAIILFLDINLDPIMGFQDTVEPGKPNVRATIPEAMLDQILKQVKELQDNCYPDGNKGYSLPDLHDPLGFQ